MNHKRNPVQHIAARLAKLKPTEVVTESARAFADGKTPYVAVADQGFLRAEIQAVARAGRELDALAPHLDGDILL